MKEERKSENFYPKSNRERHANTNLMKYPQFYRKVWLVLLSVWLSGWIAGCVVLKKHFAQSKKPVLVKIPLSAYPEFTDDMFYDGLEHGILQSLSYLNRIQSTRKFIFGKDVFDVNHMIRSMEHFLSFIRTKPHHREMKKYIETYYWVYRSVGSGNPKQVLFTGYYEPILKGSLEKNTQYKFPVYAWPEDMVSIELSLFSPRFKGETLVGRYTDQRIVPYYDRQKIEQEGALRGKARQLAWVNDPVALFFLQIQGSGKIYLDTGHYINVHYHTSNGRPYRSIGKLLIDTGKIPRSEMSMQKIRAYLQEHPEEVQKILNYNPSYVFFKIEKEGPLGYLEVKLTPGRSIAVDRRIFPLSSLAFIETKQPLIDGSGQIHRWINCTRFALIQDTGGAIRGPGRADLFWGNGPYAEIAAGHLQHRGQLYFFILKPEFQ